MVEDLAAPSGAVRRRRGVDVLLPAGRALPRQAIRVEHAHLDDHARLDAHDEVPLGRARARAALELDPQL